MEAESEEATMASNDDQMTNANEMGGTEGSPTAEPIAKKHMARRLTEAEKLQGIGVMSRMEKTRIMRPLTVDRISTSIPPQPEVVAPILIEAAPMVLEPRPRPAPGAIAIVGELATHERGFC